MRKKISQPPIPPIELPPAVVTNTDRAKLLTKVAVDAVLDGLSTGAISVNKRQRQPQLSPPKRIQVKPSLEEVQHNIQMLHQHILEQKQKEREKEQEKCRKAQSMIEKIKQEQEQHKSQLQMKKQSGVLYRRAFSESIMNRMRDKITERIDAKRKQLEEKVKQIQARSHQRVEQRTDEEISYWQKVKNMEAEKRKSVKSLPKINQFPSPGPIEIRKNTKSNEDTERKQRYEVIINSYLEQAEKKSRIRQIDSRSNPSVPKVLDSQYGFPELPHEGTIKAISQHKNVLLSYQHKRLPDSSSEIKLTDKSEDNAGDMIIQAKYATISKKDPIPKLKQQWEETLQKIKQKEIDRIKGLQMLSTIEKRLDKFDKLGIQPRLKCKYETLTFEEAAE